MNKIKRFCAVLLVLAMAVSLLPMAGVAHTHEGMDASSVVDAALEGIANAPVPTQKQMAEDLEAVKALREKLDAAKATASKDQNGALTLTEDAYAEADALFEQIEESEDALTKKGASTQKLVNAAIEIVTASDSYVEDSLEQNGEAFTWWTDGGIRCMYNPRMNEIYENMVPAADAKQDLIVNEPAATKGGTPSGTQVYLVAPYYGYDSSFTNQYKVEATRLAKAIGDPDGHTLYSGTAATIDKVAEAMSNGAIVIFDSHGTTDYANGDDFVSGANYSYLCLTNSAGLTQEDYNDGAAYMRDGGAAINGAAIANHMTKNSPSGLLWMAICLSMATDTLCEPMRQKGVEVVYGYSQSVTFAGDYLFEDTFWDQIVAGKNVSQAIAAMKNTWGNWDWSTKIASHYGYSDGYSTISAARNAYSAFPVVVSDEDAHPGQRNRTGFYGACSLQTVNSTYKFTITNSGGTGGGQSSGSGVSQNYQKLYNYIETYGSPVDGKKTWLLSSESGNTVIFYVLQNQVDSIMFEVMVDTETNTSELLSDVQFMLLESGADALPLEFIMAYYYYGSLADLTNPAGTLNRSTFTKSTRYTVPGGQAGIIPASDATETFNSCLQAVCEVWDQKIYQTHGFGLKGLGFTRYEGLGNAGCNHTYDNACDSTCNLCGETRPVNHTYSGSCDTTCNVCGYVRTGTTSHSYTYAYVNNNYHNRTCSVCGASDQVSHNWVAGAVIQQPTETTPGLREYRCSGCGAVKTEAVYMQGGGDLDGDGQVAESDAIYLLQYVLMPDLFPVTQNADFDHNGYVDESDAIYLLQHILMPDLFPL